MKRLTICVFILCGMLAVPTPVNAVIKSATVKAVPEPVLTKNSHLSSVSCVSTSFCIAVGYRDFYYSNYSASVSIAQTFSVLWNGSTWAIIPSPNIGDVPNRLSRISCVSTSFCKAVGNAGTTVTQPLAMTWNGSIWTSDSTSDLLTSVLTGVSCVSINSCVAVGSQKVGRFFQTVVAKWDGVNWGLQTSQNTAANQNNQLYSVSCPVTTYCVSVGVYQNESSIVQPLIQYWDGTGWFMVQSPSVGTNQRSELSQVSCATPTSCLAVGNRGFSSATSAVQTLAMVWDGVNWTLGQSPNTAVDRGNSLFGVSCVSTGNCLTVGTGGTGPVKAIAVKATVVRWQGNSFSYELDPALGAIGDSSRNSFPMAVSCVSADWCMAVGTFDGPVGYELSHAMSLLLGATKSTSVAVSAPIVTKKNQTLTSSRVTKAAGLSVPKGAKVTLTVSSKYKKVCKVVGTAVKTVGKGTCPVKVVVTTKSKKKTSKTVTVKVG